ncbi:hypothetical protein B296_00001666 [Ensete ventricosum]|uniref:Uncharacterized protein n=1 Tax=Ensete ventricosum TaxID=4639 RepID=A0A427A510_ENSVE|nr:hypothetical protein B296_00001666 [Ensete ventricosum]
MRQELTEGIGSLLGWRKGVRRKKIETRRKIDGANRKVCRELGSSLGVRKEFVEGIRKLTGNMPRDRRRKIVRLTTRMPEAARLAGEVFEIGKVKGITFLKILAIVPSVSDGCPAVAQESGQQATVILPRPMVVPLIPYFHSAFGGGIVGTDGCTART